jgi:3-oxoadipate enol-lactonase
MPVAKLGHINLYYEIHGKGEPLLMIIGYGSNSDHWFAILDKLARHRRVIIFDNRGTGRSDKPDIPYTSRMMMDDLAGLLDVLEISSTDVFGISMGGMIAQEFALTHPSRVKNLILGCTSCGGTEAVPQSQETRDFLFSPEMSKLTPEEKALATIPWLWNKDFIDKHPEAVKRYMAATTELPTPPQSYMCQANFLLTFSSYDRLHKVEAPTLVIHGTHDRLMPTENSKILASRIPKAELILIENAGHGFFTDSAEESSKIILDFLRRNSQARANK